MLGAKSRCGAGAMKLPGKGCRIERSTAFLAHARPPNGCCAAVKGILPKRPQKVFGLHGERKPHCILSNKYKTTWGWIGGLAPKIGGKCRPAGTDGPGPGPSSPHTRSRSVTLVQLNCPVARHCQKQWGRALLTRAAFSAAGAVPCGQFVAEAVKRQSTFAASLIRDFPPAVRENSRGFLQNKQVTNDTRISRYTRKRVHTGNLR